MSSLNAIIRNTVQTGAARCGIGSRGEKSQTGSSPRLRSPKDRLVKTVKRGFEELTPKAVKKLVRGEKTTSAEKLDVISYVGFAAGLALTAVGAPAAIGMISVIGGGICCLAGAALEGLARRREAE